MASGHREASGYRDAEARTWPDHRGRPAPDAVYPVAPDPAIGEVRTAWSNRTRTGYRPLGRREVVRLVLGLGVIVATGAVLGGAALSWALVQLGTRPPWYVPYVAMGALSLAAIAYLAKPRPKCSYVGEDGIAEHVRNGFGRRDRVLRFADVASMTIEDTARHGNGVYQGTRYLRRFRDAEGRTLLELGGIRWDHGVWSEIESPEWELTRAAEARWIEIRWARAEEALRERGEARFGGRDATFVVRSGELVLARARGEERLGPRDVDAIELADGMLVIRRVGATEGLFGSKGIDRFFVVHVEDVAVLLRALRVQGFRIAV